MVPWLTRMEWAGQWIECRMDSISWATDMSEGDYVYDAGRVIGDKGIVLWASRGFRPRFIRSSAPLAQEAGTIQVRAGDAPLTVKLEARDVAGNVGRYTVVIRAGLGPATPNSIGWDEAMNADANGKGFVLTALPYGFFRVAFGEPGATKSTASVIMLRESPHPKRGDLSLPIPRPSQHFVAVTGDSYEQASPVRARVELPRVARFDSSAYLALEGLRSSSSVPAMSRELELITPLILLAPPEPLRARARLVFTTSSKPHAGVYRYDEDGWTWVGDERKGADYAVTSGSLGWFAELVDTLGPRITLKNPPRAATPGPYNRWAIEAAITEKGSGVNARASYIVVDGKKVAAEWDPEADVLRWRPLARPAKGAHKYDVVVEDRAGNASIRSGTFVLD
jgi:hypothetical protein